MHINLVFPDGVPEKLITVHVRWGDKSREMKLVAIDEYIKAVEKILCRGLRALTRL